MKILLDENVCVCLAGELRKEGHEVLAIAESTGSIRSAGRGLPDNEVWRLACEGPFLLITRDYHFTNAVRFHATTCLGIVFLRHGNLKANEQAVLVRSFLSSYPPAQYQGKLVTLSPKGIRIRKGLWPQGKGGPQGLCAGIGLMNSLWVSSMVQDRFTPTKQLH